MKYLHLCQNQTLNTLYLKDIFFQSWIVKCKVFFFVCHSTSGQFLRDCHILISHLLFFLDVNEVIMLFSLRITLMFNGIRELWQLLTSRSSSMQPGVAFILAPGLMAAVHRRRRVTLSPVFLFHPLSHPGMEVPSTPPVPPPAPGEPTPVCTARRAPVLCSRINKHAHVCDA